MRNHKSLHTELGRSILWGILTGLSIAGAFVLGFLTRDFAAASVSASSLFSNEAGYTLLDEVQSLIDAHYLREQPSYSMRQYAAINGVLGSLEDRYTFFVDPPVAQSESDVLAGTYGGVGVQIVRSENGELQLFPFDDSPAAEAGIQDGDILIAVDHQPVTIETRTDVIDQMLRGEVKRGNGVNLRYQRNNVEDDQFIPFGVINVPSVVWRIANTDARIGYVQIIRFTSRTPDEVDEAVTELIEQAKVEGIIVDLRNNSGGLLQESVDVADKFLDGGVIVYERDNEGERIFEATNGTLVPDSMPLIVLVNGGTASAAELVAGALKDRDRAILIGQRTFGKGTVQQIYRLSDNSSVHITSAEWFTPQRYALDGQGIEPDIAMIPDENNRDVEIGEAVRQIRDVLEDGLES